MVPNGWMRSQIGEIANVQVGRDLDEERYSDVPSDKFRYPVYSNTVEARGLYGFYDFPEYPGNAVTVVGRGIGLGTAFARKENEPFGAIGRLLVLTPKNNSFDVGFLSDYINFSLRIHNESGGIPQLPGASLSRYFVTLPPLPEQKKIAQILSTWDKAITTTEQLLANSQQQKKALMQQLLTGPHPSKPRLLDKNGVRFSGEWKHQGLASLCTIKTGKKDVNEGNPEGNYPFFTCASEPTRSDSYSYDCEALLIAGNGMLGKTHYFNGKFEAYQRTYILSEFNGIDVPFLHQYILYWLMRDIEREKQHGAMPYIKLGLLQNFKVLLPCIAEQQKIATVLCAADQEISALQQKLNALKQEKKALMQQLLTGKRRVVIE